MKFLCLDFINSHWYITHKLFSDPLKDPAWILRLAEEWDVKSLPDPREEDINRLVNMRCELSQLILRQINKGILTNEDIQLINTYMSMTSSYRKLCHANHSYKLSYIPESANWKWFMAEIAASFASLLASSELKNLKICQNPECGWFFIDTSKSGTKKWCDDTCATLMKVRRFRQKQKLIE